MGAGGDIGVGGFFSDDPNLVVVGTGEYALGTHPQRIMTPALGSCVGVTLWDPFRKMGGLAHIMLPSPADSAVRGHASRFATVAIPEVVEELSRGGARQRLVAKIFGGSAMFKGDTKMSSIGDRNVEEVKRQLRLLRVAIVAEDTGGSHARTIELQLDTGVVTVRSYKYGIREL